jgi:hypothetical protein
MEEGLADRGGASGLAGERRGPVTSSGRTGAVAERTIWDRAGGSEQ